MSTNLRFDHEIKLVAADLDGTLLSDDKRLSDESMQVIKQTIEMGVKFVIASARPPRSVREFYDQLGLDTLQINYNGSLIYDEVINQPVFHQPLSGDLCKRIVDLARKLDPKMACSLEILDKWYTDFVEPDLGTQTSLFFDPDYLGPLDVCWGMEITKLMLLAPPDRLKPVHDAVMQTFRDEIAIAVSDEHLIQIMHPSVNKASALEFVAGYYGVDRLNVMAVGDAPNDVPMLKWAGLGVVVDTGWDEAKEAADVIAPGNEDHGVAWALERYVLGCG